MFGGDAGYRPRVRSVYYVRVYRHSPRGNATNIGARATVHKDSGQGGLQLARAAPTSRRVVTQRFRRVPLGALMLENVIHC